LLTADLVRVSRKKQQLQIVPRGGLDDARAAAMLTELLLLAKEHHGQSRGALCSAFDEVVVDVKEDKALRAAKKLVLDRLDFAERDDVDPPALRAVVFAAAAARRKSGAVFDRDAVVKAAADELGIDTVAVEEGLYADLEDAHVVDAQALPVDGALLVAEWADKEIQALLLRASEVTVDVDATPVQLRRLLRALKLHQLLFEVVAAEATDLSADKSADKSSADKSADKGSAGKSSDGGLLRLVIDGPMGLFSSSTRYGMKLAVLLPHLQGCRRFRLAAQVQLRKGGPREEFVTSGGVVGSVVGGAGGGAGGVEVDVLPPLVQTLLDELPAFLPGALVAAASELLSVPGHGAIVPDVVVCDADGAKAYVEVLGFWSRPAVWKRVELVEGGGLAAPVVFCFSERLRVSEEALDDDRAALLSFKGTLSAKKVAEKLSALFAAAHFAAAAVAEKPSPGPKKRKTRST